MCGIIGISSKADVSHDIMSCLKSLSYRGYDSAGMAMVGDGQISERRTFSFEIVSPKTAVPCKLLKPLTENGYQGVSLKTTTHTHTHTHYIFSKFLSDFGGPKSPKIRKKNRPSEVLNFIRIARGAF